MLRSLFIDFNSYFASVEQQLRPELRGRPVGVVPLMAETTCCIAASYEAKAFGVGTGTRVADARRLCPGIVLVEARQALYVQVHDQAVATVDRVAPVRQVLSIDEMECELTGRWRDPVQAVQLAHAVKAALATAIGPHLRSSVGIAPNTLLAKLASNMQKPDGLTVIEQQELPGRIAHLPVAAINGIGPKMLQRLALCGITTMPELLAAPREVLAIAWGGIGGSEMHDKLRGQWYGPRDTVPRSLGHSHVMPPDLRHPQGAFEVLDRLTQKAAMRLRKQGFYATAMSVSLRGGRRGTCSEQRLGRETRFGETQDTRFLLATLRALWAQGLDACARPLHVNVTLHGLVGAAGHTPQLFDAGGDAALDAPGCTPPRDRSRLDAAIDALNRVHGKNTVYFGGAHAARDAAPMRIAFGRIPDVATEG